MIVKYSDHGSSTNTDSHVDDKDKEGESHDVSPDDDRDTAYDVEPIGYFEFLVRYRNRIVEDSISIRLTSDQVRGMVDSLMDNITSGGGAGLVLKLKVDDVKSSMYYQDGLATQDFVIKIDGIESLKGNTKSSASPDASGQLVFDWS